MNLLVLILLVVDWICDFTMLAITLVKTPIAGVIKSRQFYRNIILVILATDYFLTNPLLSFIRLIKLNR